MLLDIFSGDAFSVATLTDTIIKVPYVPGQAGRAVNWQSKGVPTTSIDIEEKQGVLHLINPSPRGAPGVTLGKQKGTLRTLKIPHYQIDDAIMAEEVQGVREFGSEDALKSVEGMVNDRMVEHVNFNHNPTLEYQRIGALKGIILNADGSTLYNLFNEFGVTAPAPIPFVFNQTTSTGNLRGQYALVVDAMADELGGVPISNVGAFYGKNAWKAFIQSKEVRETYQNYAAASQLRNGIGYNAAPFEFADITHERYRGGVPNASGVTVPFVGDDEIRFFPVGGPGLFRTVFAPADYVETVNTVGKPRYAKMYPFGNGKGVHLETQMNALSYCLRPKVLLQGTYSLT